MDSPQILFIQGAGAGTHDDWDDKLVDDLRRHLGDGYTIRYPRMPTEDDPTFDAWSGAIRAELDALPDRAIVVGHSIGGTIAVATMVQHPPSPRLRALVLIAAPFVGDGGWPGDGFSLAGDTGARLPPDLTVDVFHGLADETAPPSHADLLAGAIPQARLHRLADRDHQLNNDLREVASVIRQGVDG